MVRTSRRRARAIPVVAAALVALGWCSAGVADAAISSFTLAPTSGPPGTVVNVSGKGCSPGPTVSAASDYVAVEAPGLQLYDLQVPVRKNGSWHGSFTVPADASTGLAAPVAALCVTDTLPALTTWYTPRTFTVTAPTATTTPTTKKPKGTTKKPKGTTPPTDGGAPSPGGGSGPGSTVPVFGGFPPGTSGGDAGGGTNSGGTNSGGTNSGGTNSGGTNSGGTGQARPGTTKANVKRAIGGTPAARPADLSVPALPAAHLTGAGHLGWLSWLLLLALVIAAVGAPFWLRRSRRLEEDDITAVVETR